MRRRATLALSLCLILMLAILVVGPSCTEPAAETPAAPAPAPTTPEPAPTAPAPAPAPTTPAPAPTTPAPAPEPEPEVIELTINDHNPAEGPPGESVDNWAKEVEAASGGRLKLTVIHGGALLKGNEVFRGIQTGIAAAASYALDREDGFLLNTVMALPFMGWPGRAGAGEIYMELLAKYPEMQAEWPGLKTLQVVMMPPVHIHNNVRTITLPEDMDGLKLHCAEAATAKIAEAAGAVPTELDIADMPMSLDRGLLDGVVNHFPVTYLFGALEYLPYHTVFGEGGIMMSPMIFIFNEEVLSELPADLQGIIVESGPWWQEYFLEADMGFVAMVDATAHEMGHEFNELDADQIAIWREMVKEPIHDAWLAEAEAAGLPAQAVYEDAFKMIAEYGQ